MKIKTLALLTLLIAVSICIFIANKNTKQITNLNDYEKYLQPNNEAIKKLGIEMEFWQKKLNNNKEDILAKSKIAGYLTKTFELNGEIKNLLKADSILKVINKINKVNSSTTYKALAANCITQHQFKEASLYIDSAFALGDNKFASILLKSDVDLELGKIADAEAVLKSLDQNSFEVLIRKAKITDHKGDLDGAINIMETAFDLIKDDNNEDLYCWALSNLADMYGHQNEYKKAYTSYLKVLAKQPNYTHCLKGIAWLAYAKDKDVNNAKKILHYLKTKSNAPDYDLMLAEITSFENNTSLAHKYITNFKMQTKSKLYGDMYNAYNFEILAENKNTLNEAMQIAKIEVNNRPTPMSYNLLSWAYYKLGDKQKAYEIAKQNVENKCFEPSAIANMAIIYKANGLTKKAVAFINEVQNARYEIGPFKYKEILKDFNEL